MIHKSVLLDEVAEFFRGESGESKDSPSLARGISFKSSPSLAVENSTTPPPLRRGLGGGCSSQNNSSAKFNNDESTHPLTPSAREGETQLDFKQNIFIDATLGLGGHSERVLSENPHLQVIGIDKDKISLDFAKNRLSKFGARFSAVQGSFDEKISAILERFGNLDSAQTLDSAQNSDSAQKEQGEIYGILADLGISSPQVDNLERGFSFDSPNLDMRMDLDSQLTAKAVINGYSKDELNRIFKDFGEIHNPTKIVSAILEARKKRKIESAKELCAILERTTKARGGIHPATLIFQALRIEVNDELGALHRFLDAIKNANPKGAKIAIISFHSLEDRIVKEAFKAWSAGCICDKDALKCECGGQNQKGEILTKKPIIPSKAEISRNKRARSAKMRCFRFYG